MAAQGNWTELYKYSDAVQSGDLVFCAGQTGLDETGAAPADPAEQYRLAFASLRRVLAEHGCAPGDIVDLTSFHTHYPEHMAEFMAAKADFQGDGRPAWTAIGVAALGTPETLVEIKATARIPKD
ncbi:RidA family protein [Tomitella cavernea]|uniref:RidA family protein n=1 Tax=Tomitella cavernea TaxID=1387982 RepID=A0ABP9C322_9ACTN|nr:RidA family protein [Tomitella cavernea]